MLKNSQYRALEAPDFQGEFLVPAEWTHMYSEAALRDSHQFSKWSVKGDNSSPGWTRLSEIIPHLFSWPKSKLTKLAMLMESPCKLGYQFILDIVLCFEHNKREGLRRTSHKEIPDHICMYYYKSSENPPNLLTRLQNLLQQTSIAGRLQAFPQAPRPISLYTGWFF